MNRRKFLKVCTTVLGTTCIQPKMFDSDSAATSLLADNKDLLQVRTRVPRLVTIEEVKSLPKPTLDQQSRFVNYVSSALSWCKYLPIDNGGRFVVFLASDAGEHRPSGGYLPTAEEYRREFGHLDFTANVRGTRLFYGDKLTTKEINQRFSFVLYPYVNKFQCPCLGTIDGGNIEDYTRLYRRADHPELKRVIELLNVTSERYETIKGLSEDEYQFVVRGIGVPVSHLQSARQKYARLVESREAILAYLRNRELVKIEEAVRRLHES